MEASSVRLPLEKLDLDVNGNVGRSQRNHGPVSELARRLIKPDLSERLGMLIQQLADQLPSTRI